MKIQKTILTSIILSLLLTQSANAEVKLSDKIQRGHANKRKAQIVRIQDFKQRMEKLNNNSNKLKSNNAYNPDLFGVGTLHIDLKKDLNASVFSREDDNHKEIKRTKLSKIALESIATEINIERKLKTLDSLEKEK